VQKLKEFFEVGTESGAVCGNTKNAKNFRVDGGRKDAKGRDCIDVGKTFLPASLRKNAFFGELGSNNQSILDISGKKKSVTPIPQAGYTSFILQM